MFWGCVGATPRHHVGMKYNVELFYHAFFHQLAYRSKATPVELVLMLKTRVLMNFSAFHDFYVLKIRGLGFMPRTP